MAATVLLKQTQRNRNRASKELAGECLESMSSR
jgi:hypothetical protein